MLSETCNYFNSGGNIYYRVDCMLSNNDIDYKTMNFHLKLSFKGYFFSFSANISHSHCRIIIYNLLYVHVLRKTCILFHSQYINVLYLYLYILHCKLSSL